MVYIRHIINNKIFIEICNILQSDKLHRAEYIAIKYIKMMYGISIIKHKGAWCMPKGMSSTVVWMKHKLLKIQKRIIDNGRR